MISLNGADRPTVVIARLGLLQPEVAANPPQSKELRLEKPLLLNLGASGPQLRLVSHQPARKFVSQVTGQIDAAIRSGINS